MNKAAKIFIYFLLGAIAILIVYIIVTGKKEKGLPPSQKTANPNNNNNPNINTDNTDASAAGIDTNTTPTPINNTVIPIGANVYAGEDLLNVYNDCFPSQSNIYGTYKKGEFIGTFLEKQDVCTKVAIPTYYTAYFIGSWKTGSDTAYIPFNAKIYFK